ncbi:MAG TPA: MATE family efflux transporter [Paenalcaligenes sp.]|nr:MATE family efflux transporter [Paenalcaligenes sp.]
MWLKETRASIKLGYPLILTNLAQIAILTTNTIYFGQLGKAELAAASLAASLYQVTMIFSLGLVSATVPMLANVLGQRRSNIRQVRRILRHGFLSALLIALPFWLLLWHADTLLIALGQRPETVQRALPYMHTLQWGLLPYLLYIVLRSFLAALERPLWTFLIACLGILFNAALGGALIFGALGMPAMGLIGGGISATLTSTFMFLGMALLVHKKRPFRRYHAFGNWWRFEWAMLRELWQLGVPIAITFTLETLIFYAGVIMMGLIGETALAAHAIAMQISSVTYMIPLGFSQVATIRVGLSYGRARLNDAIRAGWVAYALGVGFMGLAALMMWLFPERLAALFIRGDSEENLAVLYLAAHFLVLAAIFQIADGAQAVAAGMLRGLYDTRTPMLLALIGYWVLGVPIGAFLAFGVQLQGTGVWLGFTAGLSVVAVLLTLRWHRFAVRLQARAAAQA